MSHQPVFDSAQNQALLVVCARKTIRNAAVLGIVAALDVPIIHFSVVWWRTLHQPPTVLKPQAPSMDPAMLLALVVNVAAFLCAFAYLAARRYRLLGLEAAARRRALGQTLQS